MPNELNDLPRCNCGAVFLRDEDLSDHTRENEKYTISLKELIRFVSAQLERSVIHSRIQDNAAVDDKPCRKHKDTEGRFHCPRWGCDFKATKPNHLLKHYGRYIPVYNEPPCVRCGKSAETIGQFLDHAKLHDNDGGDSIAKTEYLTKRCEELRKIRDDRLTLEETKIRAPSVSVHNKRRKRKAASQTSNADTSATRIDSLFSQTGSSLLPQQMVGSSTDAVAPRCNSPTSSRSFNVQLRLDLPPNQNSSSGNGAAMLHSSPQGIPHEFRPPSNSSLHAIPQLISDTPTLPTNLLSGLETESTAFSHARLEGNMSIPLPHETAQNINTLSQLGADPFNNDSATNIAMLPAHLLPLEETAPYGAIYDDFSPIVTALNFATR